STPIEFAGQGISNYHPDRSTPEQAQESLFLYSSFEESQRRCESSKAGLEYFVPETRLQNHDRRFFDD
ncbi:MAG: hypothetical protein WCF75_26110, partial [Pseudolabrys sp.]